MKRDYSRRAVLGTTGGLSLTALVGTRAFQRGPPERDEDSHNDVEGVSLRRVGRYETGEFDGGAEIVAYDASRSRLFVVNSGAGQIEVLDVTDPAAPEQAAVLDAAADVDNGGGANSVDVVGDLVAVAVENENPQAAGFVALYDPSELELLAVADVGALPDKVTITPDGQYVLSANEGEPAFDESPGSRTDPRGSISIIDVTRRDAPRVETLDFTPFDDDIDALRAEGVRVYGASAAVEDPRPSTDFEPEFVTVTPDSGTAYVSLQENNAVARVDIQRAEIAEISGLGFKDFSLPGNELDTSDADAGDEDVISFQNWPVKGMYQPDGIRAYEVAGRQYLITANEGDSRDYEVSTVSDLSLADDAFAPRLSENPFVDSVEALKRPENLGNLEVTNQLGDHDNDGQFEELYLFGTRSFAIWEATDNGLQLVFESGNELPKRYAEQFPAGFQGATSGGPQTEGIEIGQVGDRTFAFVGIERGSGIFVYDVTTPANPRYIQTVVNRDFSIGFGDLAENPESPGRGGDFSPEGLEFISADGSPTNNPLFAAGYEVSGTVALFEVTPLPEDAAAAENGPGVGRGRGNDADDSEDED
ncbi:MULTISPECIES: choice-of-anchor I family protein [unclassified Halorubrum]|uniref:choice-of-anchor I family protein n=1 Tax=unclassified Halorubrum TaxID=2642239 RepID=UPI0018EE78EB|nr:MULTISPECIES: choice-of-anchor I family protein [unclassified Halorubrum]